MKTNNLTAWSNRIKLSKARRKAQANVLEYIFLTFFVIVVIVGLIFFLTGWSTMQLSLDKEKLQWDTALFLSKNFQNLPALTHDRSMFDDSKLTALVSFGQQDACKYLDDIMGSNWFAEITSFDGNTELTDCTYANYPDCNHWVLCKQEGRKTTAFVMPINVYRKFGLEASNRTFSKVELGTLELGVYE